MKLKPDDTIFLNRTKCITDDLYFNQKKIIIENIFSIAVESSDQQYRPVIVSTHQANICQLPGQKAIVCDIHFLDIAQLVASSFYVEPYHDINRLMHLLLADSFICSEDLSLALTHAKQYISGPYVSAFNSIGDERVVHKVLASRQAQTTFALLHEFAHEKYTHTTGVWATITALIKPRIAEIIADHNRIATIINSTDISPLIPEMHDIPYKDAFSFPTPNNASEIILHSTKRLVEIIERNLEKVDVPTEDVTEKKQIIIYACENYLRGLQENTLDPAIMIEECTCDMIALFELLDFSYTGCTREESILLSIEAFYLCLLAQDLVYGAMNVQRYSRGRGYQNVDYVFMRRRYGPLLLPDIVSLHIMAHEEHFSDDFLKKVFSCKDQAYTISENMYLVFSESAFNEDYSDIDKYYIPQNSSEGISLRLEAERLLRLPV